jgi:DNA replication protein DnaC
VSEALDISCAANLNRAYEAAQSVTKCQGCGKDGKITVTSPKSGEYRLPCPLLNAECRYGRELRRRLDAHASSRVLSIPRLPAIFRDNFTEPRITAAVQGARKWASDPKSFLLLHGDHGTGKSFAAAYALYVVFRKSLLANWKYPLAWGMPNAMWLGAYEAAAKDELFEAAKAAPLLVLDDLGSEESTQKAKGRISEIVSERYNQRRTTILTMNEDVLRLPSLYNPRMADRVIGAGNAVHCGGESLRLTS